MVIDIVYRQVSLISFSVAIGTPARRTIIMICHFPFGSGRLSLLFDRSRYVSLSTRGVVLID